MWRLNLILDRRLRVARAIFRISARPFINDLRPRLDRQPDLRPNSLAGQFEYRFRVDF